MTHKPSMYNQDILELSVFIKSLNHEFKYMTYKNFHLKKPDLFTERINLLLDIIIRRTESIKREIRCIDSDDEARFLSQVVVPDQGKESCLLSYICLPTLVPVLDSVLSSTFFIPIFDFHI